MRLHMTVILGHGLPPCCGAPVVVGSNPSPANQASDRVCCWRLCAAWSRAGPVALPSRRASWTVRISRSAIRSSPSARSRGGPKTPGSGIVIGGTVLWRCSAAETLGRGDDSTPVAQQVRLRRGRFFSLRCARFPFTNLVRGRGFRCDGADVQFGDIVAEFTAMPSTCGTSAIEIFCFHSSNDTYGRLPMAALFRVGEKERVHFHHSAGALNLSKQA